MAILNSRRDLAGSFDIIVVHVLAKVRLASEGPEDSEKVQKIDLIFPPLTSGPKKGKGSGTN